MIHLLGEAFVFAAQQGVASAAGLLRPHRPSLAGRGRGGVREYVIHRMERSVTKLIRQIYVRSRNVRDC